MKLTDRAARLRGLLESDKGEYIWSDVESAEVIIADEMRKLIEQCAEVADEEGDSNCDHEAQRACASVARYIRAVGEAE